MILHITNMFPSHHKKSNPIIKKIITHLRFIVPEEQVVFHPIKMILPERKIEVTDEEGIKVYHIPIWGLPYGLFILTRLLTSAKKIYDFLNRNFNVDEIKLIHAHTLISDGFIAYYLFSKFQIPYIVSVRSTDVNEQLRYIPYIKPIAFKIVENASFTICITPSIRDKLISFFDINDVKEKILIIPNGIDEELYSINNCDCPKRRNSLIFVGKLIYNKNVQGVLKAVKYLKSKGHNLSFTVVGDGPMRKKLEKLSKKMRIQNNVAFAGKKPHNETLREIKKHQILILTSFKETFGLVYLEALAMCTPIIYSKNTGVDGLFSTEVGKAVNPKDPIGIANAILNLLSNYSVYQGNIRKFLKTEYKRFGLLEISKKLGNIYIKANPELLNS